MIENDPKACLELLPELPGTRDGCRGIVQYIANEMKPCHFPGDWCSVHQQRCNNNVNDLEVSLNMWSY